MPIGKVKFFDAERGFGLIGGDDSAEVFLHASALPEGAAAPKLGTRVKYGAADGRKGPRALTVKILPPTRPASAARRCKPQAMVPVVEDFIKPLGVSSTVLHNGKYPENSWAIAKVLRAVADDPDA